MAEDNIVSPTNKDFVSPVSGDDSEQLALKNREEYINVARQLSPLPLPGYQNWIALRHEWKRRPEGWVPPKKKQVDYDQLYEELSAHDGMISERIPLTDFVRVMSEIWETEGVN